MITAYKILFMLTVVSLGSVVGCSGDSALTVGDAYERMLVGMTEEGSVLHTTLSSEVVDTNGVVTTSVEREFWVDVPNDRYREKLLFLVEVGLPETSIQIYDGGDLYVLTDSEALRAGVADRCAGSDSGLLFGYLRCITTGGITTAEQDPQAYEGRTFDGVDVVALVFRGLSQADSQAGPAVSELHLDPETFLPIARIVQGPDSEERQFLHRYEHEFLPRKSLPSDFFEHGPTATPKDR